MTVDETAAPPPSHPQRRRKRSRFTSSATAPEPAQPQQPQPQQPPHAPPTETAPAAAPQTQHVPPAVAALRARVAAALPRPAHEPPVTANAAGGGTAPPPAKRRRSRFAPVAAAPAAAPPQPPQPPPSLSASVPEPVLDDLPPPPPTHAPRRQPTRPPPQPQPQPQPRAAPPAAAPSSAALAPAPRHAAAIPVTAIPTGPVPTLRINREVEQKRRVSAVLQAAERDMVSADPQSNAFHDSALSARRARPATRAFADVQPGATARAAELQRARGAAAARRAAYAAERLESAQNVCAAQPVLPPRADEVCAPSARGDGDATPLAEWWDVPFLRGGADSLADPDACVVVRDTRITHYVHHPPRVAPAQAARAPPELRLMLTKAEAKRLRRQRRADAQSEARELVAAGLAEPAPPKVKLSNVVRVLGSQASADPTKVEAAVRAQVEERRRRHEAANEARRRTPLEKREKRREKREKDRAAGLRGAVFRVGRGVMAMPVRYKVGVNATQNDLAGLLVLCRGCNVVVVEGGAKALQKYKKLMLRRIDWAAAAAGYDAAKRERDRKEKVEPGEEDAASSDEKKQVKEEAKEDVKMEDVEEAAGDDKATVHDDDAAVPDALENAETGAGDSDAAPPDFGCVLVWEGELAGPNFEGFETEMVKGESAARSLLRKHRVEHYWELCVQASPLGNDKLGKRTV